MWPWINSGILQVSWKQFWQSWCDSCESQDQLTWKWGRVKMTRRRIFLGFYVKYNLKQVFTRISDDRSPTIVWKHLQIATVLWKISETLLWGKLSRKHSCWSFFLCGAANSPLLAVNTVAGTMLPISGLPPVRLARPPRWWGRSGGRRSEPADRPNECLSPPSPQGRLEKHSSVTPRRQKNNLNESAALAQTWIQSKYE